MPLASDWIHAEDVQRYQMHQDWLLIQQMFTQMSVLDVDYYQRVFWSLQIDDRILTLAPNQQPEKNFVPDPWFWVDREIGAYGRWCFISDRCWRSDSAEGYCMLYWQGHRVYFSYTMARIISPKAEKLGVLGYAVSWIKFPVLLLDRQDEIFLLIQEFLAVREQDVYGQSSQSSTLYRSIFCFEDCYAQR